MMSRYLKSRGFSALQANKDHKKQVASTLSPWERAGMGVAGCARIGMGVLTLGMLLPVAGLRAQAPELPQQLAAAPANNWVMLDAGGYGQRRSVGLVYLPAEQTFLILGGAMEKGSPYTEMTLNWRAARWENRFPPGKEGLWGDVTGLSKAPPRPYGGPAFTIGEDVVRPHLDYGYNHKMEIWGNAAYDAARGRVVVPFHRLTQTWEYDPRARNWSLAVNATNAPYTFWDDMVFGAMCYDPVNKEVLAGQCRWALRDGRWMEIQFEREAFKAPRMQAETLALDLRKLVGACRARFFLTESEAMARANLAARATALLARCDALAIEFAAAAGRAGGYEKQQLVWAGSDLKEAREKLAAAAELLAAGRMTAATIAAVADVWEALDDVIEDLAAAPPKRAYCRLAVDVRRGKILVFGGHRLDRLLADTWIYDCATRLWEQRRPALAPAPRYGHGLVWLPQSGLFLLIDGANQTGNWIYDIEANEWRLLSEAGGPRESLTSVASTWGFQPEMSAAAPGDVVITLSNRSGRQVPRFSTWAARIDPAKIDLEGTRQQGVPFRTESFVGGKTASPRWYDEEAGTIDGAAQEAWLKALPANVWTVRDRKQQRNNPGDNRAWGTTVFDPDRDQMLQWGGGHVAYVGNSVLHYSIKADRFYIGHRTEQSLMYAHGQGGMKMALSYRRRAFMTGHSYHSYGYDQPSGKLLVAGQALSEETVKASHYYCYDPAAGEWFPNPFPTTGTRPSYSFDRLCPTTRGVVRWASGRLWRPDVAALKWEQLPLEGPALPKPSHEGHGMTQDLKRDRLLFFNQGSGNVLAYDFQSGLVTAIAPPPGADAPIFKKLFCRELVYLPEWDGVLIASRVADAEGRMRWPFYDCTANTWYGLLLGGNDPIPKAYNVSLGLMYDAARKLVWAADHVATISVLRLDLKLADRRPLVETPAAASDN